MTFCGSNHVPNILPTFQQLVCAKLLGFQSAQSNGKSIIKIEIVSGVAIIGMKCSSLKIIGVFLFPFQTIKLRSLKVIFFLGASEEIDGFLRLPSHWDPMVIMVYTWTPSQPMFQVL